MSQDKISKADIEFYDIFRLENMNSVIHRMNPIAKLVVTLVYIILVMSFDKYDIFRLFAMILIPVTFYQLSLIPVRTCFYKLKIVLPFVVLVGIFNPFFDREILFYLGRIPVSGGVVSMLTVLLKGVFCLMMSFLLIATTKIEDICRALIKMHFPKVFVDLILLTFRYIFVLTEEAKNMWTSYKLRAPGQKGIKMSAWGSFLGLLIMRTMDRGKRIQENMIVRGYGAEYKAGK